MFDPLSNFKLNKILSAVNALPTTLASSFTEVKNAIAGVQNTANTINKTTKSIDTNVDTLVAGRVVKSVQRGVFSGNISLGYTNPTTATVTKISTVNTNKAILIINNFGANGYEGHFSFKLNASNISVSYSENNVVTLYGLDWQVIEFY